MLFFKTYLSIRAGKKVGKQYKSNKPKIITPKWNDEFELPDGSCSMSDIQDCTPFNIIMIIQYYHEEHKKFTRISPIHVYIT